MFLYPPWGRGSKPFHNSLACCSLRAIFFKTAFLGGKKKKKEKLTLRCALQGFLEDGAVMEIKPEVSSTVLGRSENFQFPDPTSFYFGINADIIWTGSFLKLHFYFSYLFSSISQNAVSETVAQVQQLLQLFKMVLTMLVMDYCCIVTFSSGLLTSTLAEWQETGNFSL